MWAGRTSSARARWRSPGSSLTSSRARRRPSSASFADRLTALLPGLADASLRRWPAGRVPRCDGEGHLLRSRHRARHAGAVRPRRPPSEPRPNHVGGRRRPLRRDDGVPGRRARRLPRRGRPAAARDAHRARTARRRDDRDADDDRSDRDAGDHRSGGDREARLRGRPRADRRDLRTGTARHQYRRHRGRGPSARHPGSPRGRT